MGVDMAIRKRSALLLGAFGFLAGVAYAQYQRRRLAAVPRLPAKPALPDKAPHIPMQVVDETMATARQSRDKAGHTTH
jgi:hypothetical protein